MSDTQRPGFLNPQQGNRSHCKSCIFHPDPACRLVLDPKREVQIVNYLTTFQASHVCHQTGKTCYGGLELQAKAAWAVGLIEEPTVSSLQATAAQVLASES